MRNKNSQHGFSLVEVLVSVTVLIILSVVLTQALSRTFKGNTKSEQISTIKQNGQYMLTVIENDIRSSDEVICSTSQILVLHNYAGNYVRFILTTEDGSNNGKISREIFTYSDNLTQPANMCDLNNTPNPSPIPFPSQAPILNNDALSLNPVSIKTTNSPGFSVDKRIGYKDVVAIKFDLGPGLNTGGSSLDVYSFQTSIQLR